MSAPYILAADIGGTRSRFALFQGGTLLQESRLASADFGDLGDALAVALKSLDPPRLDAACFALAGPIDDDGVHARLTNLPWRVDAVALASRFGLPAIRLVNDFAAAALGAVTAKPAHRLTLQAGRPLADSPCLVLGAGTGLGMATVLPQPGPDGTPGWRILPGEGGHLAFAPADAEQSRLLDFLRQRHGRVTWERVVSGPGLAAIHAFLNTTAPGLADHDPAAIGKQALRDREAGVSASAEARALDLFLAAYGAFAGDMALALLARGGVFLAGGIAAEILPALQRGPFLPHFNAKAEHAALATRMPVHVITDPTPGLRGAAALAQG